MQVEIKSRFTGAALFTAELAPEYENQSAGSQLGAAVRMAVRACADLTGAVLTRADLTGADLTRAALSGADLRGANLTDTVLTGADLRGAVLRGTVLTDTNLTDAVLTGADLRGADLRGTVLTDTVLRGTVLRGANLRVYQGIYKVIVTPSHVQIGCERRTPEQWLELTEDIAYALDGDRAVEALRQESPVIRAMIEQVRPDLVEPSHPTSQSTPGALRRALAFVWPMEGNHGR